MRQLCCGQHGFVGGDQVHPLRGVFAQPFGSGAATFPGKPYGQRLGGAGIAACTLRAQQADMGLVIRMWSVQRRETRDGRGRIAVDRLFATSGAIGVRETEVRRSTGRRFQLIEERFGDRIEAMTHRE